MSSTPSENGSTMPLRPALKDSEEPMSPQSGPVKVVSIAEPSDINTPPLSAVDDSSRIKQFKARLADKRMTGKSGFLSHSASKLSLVSMDDSAPQTDNPTPKYNEEKHQGRHHHHRHHHEKFVSQVAAWLEAEKAKHHERKLKKKGGDQAVENDGTKEQSRRSSQSSDSGEISLERLQKILEGNMSTFSLDSLPDKSPNFGPRRPSNLSIRRRSSIRKMAVSSDTEYQDGDVIVPSCDVVLDNSKTMSYSGGVAESSRKTVTLNSSKRAEKERRAWVTFKGDIWKLAHTLRLKGWRRVPFERAVDIEVTRLSGALTNAVYVVAPPTNLPEPAPMPENPMRRTPKPPPKLLLRIYGPQVEHLIDRENELSILRRLARKRIGPRMLGTFTNGRFEEFFNAKTLTADDLRIEGTSKQIAKRMRELHDGIDLLEREREEGPFVWLNWDKWVDRCTEVGNFLDNEISSGQKGNGEFWRTRGYVAGVPWPQFKAAIDKYRKWLAEYYGKNGVERRLVFAHNDTQYGNILRLVPETSTKDAAPSPLLLPQNTHKQLVVIDFEYASANTPGLEFANHFTEWCYNYHDPSAPWACDTKKYPTLEQQQRFIRSYVNHRPQFISSASSTPSVTPKMNPMDGMSRGSIGGFLLDSRTPGGAQFDLGAASLYDQEEAQREREVEKQVNELLKEVQIWRIANSAQWVAWGIVQAKVPGLEPETAISDGEHIEESPPSNGHDAADSKHVNGDGNDHPKENTDKRPDEYKAEALRAGETVKEAEALEDEEDEFDYLAYARDRAMFFWADMVGMGIIEREELPEDVIKELKFIDGERCLLGRAKWRQ